MYDIKHNEAMRRTRINTTTLQTVCKVFCLFLFLAHAYLANKFLKTINHCKKLGMQLFLGM